MKKERKIIDTPEILNVTGNPETAEELINKYGTYNIQPTADTENDFPKIAQGLAKPKNRCGLRENKDKKPKSDIF